MPSPQRFLREILPIRSAVHDPARSWMADVVATGIGPKFVEGRPTAEPALHFFVRRKVARAKLSRPRVIPKMIEGYATDVVPPRGAAALDSFALPGQGLSIGFGQAILGSTGERGTVGCCGTDMNGNTVLITAGHVVPVGASVMDDAGTVTLGQTIASFGTIRGDVLYPGTSAGARPCAIDAAVVGLADGLTPQGGLPNGHSFVLQGWQETYNWIMRRQNAHIPAEAAALGPVHTGQPRQQTIWRRGIVVSLLPAVVADGITYFCAIDDHQLSERGDSGSLWIGNDNGAYVAIGLHHGFMNGTGHELVTDIASALPHIGVTSLLTQ
jgi:hypothetical protein